MTRHFACGVAIAALMTAPALAETVTVTSAADAGAGSLRAALEAAAGAEAPVQILLASGDIALESGLVYAGRAPLTLIGRGQVLSGAANETLLTVAQGADLTVSDLTFAGPGGFSIEARGDLDGPAGKGLFVDLRDDQEGVMRLVLDGVTVRDVAGHGIHVSDCSLADDCGGGGGGAGEGSAAGISVVLTGVTVERVGQGRFDADGLRVDERGAGDIEAVLIGSTFTGVGADGVELDEGQEGSVRVTAIDTSFTANGDYCHPDLLGAFLPEADEGEFEEGAMAEADIPGPVTGSPDDACFEREVDTYDDGSVEAYEFAIDTDDGFDVDEAGPGSVIAVLSGIRISDNFDEGLDYDEEDEGDIVLTLSGLTGEGNSDDAVKMSEEGAGDVRALVDGSEARDNGGKGMVFEEADGGDLDVSLAETRTSGNDGGETGLEAVQEDDGAGRLQVTGGEIADGVETEGVDRM